MSAGETNSFRVEDGDNPGLAIGIEPAFDMSLAGSDESSGGDLVIADELACCLNFEMPVRFLWVGNPVVEDLKVGACGGAAADDWRSCTSATKLDTGKGGSDPSARSSVFSLSSRSISNRWPRIVAMAADARWWAQTTTQ